MTPARWHQIKGILKAVLELEGAEERRLSVATACAGDAALQREVESFLVPPTADLERYVEGSAALASDSLANSNNGRRVGAYRLVQELGRGGMGVVWLAERADDRFEHQVAIKLLKRGTDTDEVLRRFHAERRILARLDHPGIARLFDGGETDDGLPFFVMEYVAGGERLTAFAMKRELSLRARVELFCKVCMVVQFAHQNLVVHRDLKPGNILVTPEGEPKLLDFGIARLVGNTGDGVDSSDVTSAESRRLTPAYASPEQVQGGTITTASDIYSLGALLYELLTERPPYQFATDRPTTAELERIVEGPEPRRPSLVALPSEIRKRLRGDLDNILLRAMARDPARRYQNASGLADDLQRHLASRPVRASPNTFHYRTAKFVGRNKPGVIAAILLAVALATGVTATLWEARRAERRFGEVRALTNSYLFEIHDAIRALPGSTAARQLIVSKALEYLDRLAQDSAGDKTLQLELANAYLKVGDVQGRPYTANLGDSAGALRSYTKAVEIAAPVAASEHGSSSAARRILSQADESLGVVQSRLHQWEDATRSHLRALSLREQLLKSDPAHAEEWQRGIVANHIGLGDAVMSENRVQPAAGYQHVALKNYRRALSVSEALVEAYPDSAAASAWLAKSCARTATELSELGEAEHDPAAFRESASLHRRAVTLDEAAARLNPTNPAVRRTLADELIAFAYLQSFSGEDLPGALDACRRAQAIVENLATSDPANAEARQDLSTVNYVTGRVLQKKGELTAAAESYRSCLTILEPLVAAHPDNVETAFDLKRVRAGVAEIREAKSNEGQSW